MLVALLAAAALMSGCAAPAVTIAGLAADGASYATSGKSLSDHALSAATGSDCSVLGMLDDGVLCHDRVPEPEVVIAQGPPPLAEPPAPARLPAPVDNSAATFLALGAYPDWENADHAVVQGRFYNPLIVPIEGDEAKAAAKGAAYWVIAGRPLAGADGKTPIAQAQSIGFADARTVTLCRATYRPGPCAGDANVAEAAQSDGANRQAASVPSPAAANVGEAKNDAATQSTVAQAPAPPKPVAPPVADDVPTPLVPRPAQLAARPMPPDTATLY
jgi:hypothetical protein